MANPLGIPPVGGYSVFVPVALILYHVGEALGSVFSQECSAVQYEFSVFGVQFSEKAACAEPVIVLKTEHYPRSIIETYFVSR
jgi:hypothetical protein